MTSSRNTAIERLRDAATRVAGTHGLEVFDVQVRRESVGKVLRVIIDRPAPVPVAGAPAPEEPVGIEDCQRVSQDLGALLDVEDELTADLGEGFTLEVSSPGLERPLRRAEHFRRSLGRQVKVKTKAPMAGSRTHLGTLAAADDEGIVLVEGDYELPIALTDIASARTVVDWDAELKGSNA